MSHNPNDVDGVLGRHVDASAARFPGAGGRRRERTGMLAHHRASIIGLTRGALAIAIILLGSRNILADGWKVQLQGVKALGVSFAGRSVILDDASTVWFNPAGMTRLKKRWVITTAAPLVTYSLDYTDGGSSSALGQALTGPAGVDGGTTSAVPHFYAAGRLSDRVSLGVGVNFPVWTQLRLRRDLGGALPRDEE